jgi:peptide/nickel transport system permease protein
MILYVLRRLATLVVIAAALSVIVFALIQALPGDPAVMRAGGVEATPESVARARQELGLDLPLAVQYGRFVRNVLVADFGRSLITRQPIAEALRLYLPATVELALVAMLLSCTIGVPAGMLAAVYRNRWPDRLIKPVSIFAASMPLYWLGLVAVLVFYRLLGLLPAGGRLGLTVVPPPFATGLFTVDSLLAGDPALFADAVHHLVLPAAVLSGLPLGTVLNVTRIAFLDVLGEAYINTARAKGLSEARVIAKHALKNAAVPIVTVAGLQLGQLLGGVILTETIFSWPGRGLYMVQAIDTVDYPVIMACTLVYSVAGGLLNFLVDLLYLRLNPRLAM